MNDRIIMPVLVASLVIILAWINKTDAQSSGYPRVFERKIRIPLRSIRVDNRRHSTLVKANLANVNSRIGKQTNAQVRPSVGNNVGRASPGSLRRYIMPVLRSVNRPRTPTTIHHTVVMAENANVLSRLNRQHNGPNIDRSTGKATPNSNGEVNNEQGEPATDPKMPPNSFKHVMLNSGNTLQINKDTGNTKVNSSIHKTDVKNNINNIHITNYYSTAGNATSQPGHGGQAKPVGQMADHPQGGHEPLPYDMSPHPHDLGHGPQPHDMGHAPQPHDLGGHGLQPHDLGGHGLQPHDFGGHGPQPHAFGGHGPQPHDLGGHGAQPHEVGHGSLPHDLGHGQNPHDLGYRPEPQHGGPQPQHGGPQPGTTKPPSGMNILLNLVNNLPVSNDVHNSNHRAQYNPTNMGTIGANPNAAHQPGGHHGAALPNHHGGPGLGGGLPLPADYPINGQMFRHSPAQTNAGPGHGGIGHGHGYGPGGIRTGHSAPQPGLTIHIHNPGPAAGHRPAYHAPVTSRPTPAPTKQPSNGNVLIHLTLNSVGNQGANGFGGPQANPHGHAAGTQGGNGPVVGAHGGHGPAVGAHGPAGGTHGGHGPAGGAHGGHGHAGGVHGGHAPAAAAGVAHG